MAVFAIGDLHLSFGVEKPMDIFEGWKDYTKKLEENWQNTITNNDTVVLAGDSSWAMNLSQAYEDFAFINALPGRQKLILKGNHDYWWTSAAKMNEFFASNGFDTLRILHNNAYEVDGFAICGSRGWIFENGAAHDEKIVNREAQRIKLSVKASEKMRGERILFLHYPPVYAGQQTLAFLDIMEKNGITRCFYGHIHGAGHKNAQKGYYCGVDYTLISADYLRFAPLKIDLTLNN